MAGTRFPFWFRVRVAVLVVVVQELLRLVVHCHCGIVEAWKDS
jgi:hypothetical protein